MREARAQRKVVGTGLGAAALLCAAPASAQLLNPTPLSATVAATTPGRPAPALIGGGWSMAGLQTDDLQLAARVDLQAGAAVDPAVAWPGFAPAPGQETPWRRVGLGLNAAWAATPTARLILDAGHALEVQSVVPTGLGAVSENQHNETFAGARLGLEGEHGLRLDLTGRTRQVDDALSDFQGLGDRVQVRSDETAAGAALHWAATKRLSLDLGADLDAADMAWRNFGQTRQTYETAEPRLAASLTPWSGAKWTLSYGRAATPVDVGAFAAVALNLQRSGQTSAVAGLEPNREWRAQASLTQALPGAGNLSLDLVQARLENVTELTRNIYGADLPGEIDGGTRQQLGLTATLPLAPIGLDGLSLETGGAVRQSEVVDPITGAPRRLSGEAPYDGHLTVSQDIRPLDLRWGVKATTLAAQTSYTPEEATVAAPLQSVGMFVEYRPQAFALRLQVDGLAGGERAYSDAFYDGSRASGRVVRTDARLDGGPAVSLMLRKSL